MNRRIRNRTYGGVGGRGRKAPAYPITIRFFEEPRASARAVMCNEKWHRLRNTAQAEASGSSWLLIVDVYVKRSTGKKTPGKAVNGIMRGMSESFPLPAELPPAAVAAVAIVRRLAEAGHVALLAGGCVRDLLLGRSPNDYDVATDAPPDQVQKLFRATRHVGAQFGVVLVRSQRRWVEVATFRVDGPYPDGRHPARVTFSTPREDARRRDFTVNGMFCNPLQRTVIDYVGGRADLQARLIRAIGEPTDRFDEDHLRLLRAVRFAARLEFEFEPLTLAAIRENASKLYDVAAERVREELEKILLHQRRRRAFALLCETGLLPFLWPGATWSAEQIAATDTLLSRLPISATFELSFAALIADQTPAQVQKIARELAFSNRQRENVTWLVRHQTDLDDPSAITLSVLKRLMAHRAFTSLRQLTDVRHMAEPDGAQQSADLAARLAGIAPETIQPPPFVTGDDLAARGVAQGPIYGKILDALYTRQLEETLQSREEALAALEELL